jgi:hypothetical protein
MSARLFSGMLLGLCVSSTFAAAPRAGLPSAFPASRYDKMMAISPFNLASATIPPRVKGPGPFVHLHIATLARIIDPDGNTRDLVTIASRAEGTLFTLEGSEPNKDGFQIARIDWSDRVGETKVLLKKGDALGMLEFDKALLTTPAAGSKYSLPQPNALPPRRVEPIRAAPISRPDSARRRGIPARP